MSKPKRWKYILGIVAGAFLIAIELSTSRHGLVAPIDAQSVGYDIWGAIVYIWSIWSIQRGVRFFLSKDQSADLSKVPAPDISSTP